MFLNLGRQGIGKGEKRADDPRDLSAEPEGVKAPRGVGVY